MARQPRLKDKSGYWYSESGGKAMQSGRVGLFPHAEAEARWREYLGSITRPAEPVGPHGEVIVTQLAFDFLKWVGEKRGDTAHYHRNLHIGGVVARRGRSAGRSPLVAGHS